MLLELKEAIRAKGWEHKKALEMLERHSGQNTGSNQLFPFVGDEQLKALFRLDSVQAEVLVEFHDRGLTAKMLDKMPTKGFSVAHMIIFKQLMNSGMSAAAAVRYFNDNYDEYYHQGFNSVLGRIHLESYNNTVSSPRTPESEESENTFSI